MTQYTFDHWEVNGVTYNSVQLNTTIVADTTIIAFYRETDIPPPVQAGFPIWIVPIALIGIGITYMLSNTKKK